LGEDADSTAGARRLGRQSGWDRIGESDLCPGCQPSPSPISAPEPIAASDGGQQVFTPEEAAALLRVSRTSIYKLMKTRELRSTPIGRRRLIPRSAIDDFLAG
jgi:excisionase family DNA binding protein